MKMLVRKKRSMREWIKLFIAACLYYGGLVKLVRWRIQRRGSCLLILNYHRAVGGDLRSHLLYLRQHYRLLHLEEALDELYMPHKKQMRLHDRRTPLVLTFDDGYRDNYTHGFALACELEIPITIFLVPGYMETGHCFWWQEADHLVNHAQVDKITINGRAYHLALLEERKALIQTIDSNVRYAVTLSEREEFLRQIRMALAVPSTSTLEDIALPLKWTEVFEMEKSGRVSFGAHTMHHPILACLRDFCELQYEVGECRTVIEQQLGHPVRTFAYPIGGPEHIGDDALQAIQDAGYDWAVTTIPGINTIKSNPYLLRRIETDVDRHWLILAAETVGLWQLISTTLRRSSLSSRQREE